ncbi:MAG: hypothetical protein ACLFVW_02990 [Phycisphaerae bacterium]
MADKSPEARLLGLGLDNEDGHVRVTRGENFHLYGGSAETHEEMQDKCIRFNEKLSERGKRLDDLERRELADIAGECDMNLLSRHRPGREQED